MQNTSRSTKILTVVLLACSILTHGDEEPGRAPDVHFVPTPHEVVEIMLRLADIKKDDVVYDLGCGDGRIVIAAAKKAGCKAVGYDIDPEMVRQSRENVKQANVEHLVTIEEADIFTLDLSGATVITLYLLPSLNVRLIPQLEKLRPGARIVSHDFDMKGVYPDVECHVSYPDQGSRQVRKAYLWTTPLNKMPEITDGSEIYYIQPDDVMDYPQPDSGSLNPEHFDF